MMWPLVDSMLMSPPPLVMVTPRRPKACCVAKAPLLLAVMWMPPEAPLVINCPASKFMALPVAVVPTKVMPVPDV